MSFSAHKPTYHHSSLLDIPPIGSSPSHSPLKNKKFESEVDKLLNFDDDNKDEDKAGLGYDSLEKLLESSRNGQKEETVSMRLFSEKSGVQGSTKLSDLPGLSSLGTTPQAGVEDDDPLLSVLKGTAKRPIDVPPLNPAKDSGLGKLPPISGAPRMTIQPKEQSKAEYVSEKPANHSSQADTEKLLISEQKPDKVREIPKRFSDTFAAKVPNHTDDILSGSAQHQAWGNGQGNGGGDDLDDERSLACSVTIIVQY